MFKKATKEQGKLRLAIFGTCGAGKTYSSLKIASGLGDKVALIDTENNTACKYSDKFDFDVCSTTDNTIEALINIIKNARDYEVLIIDSLSHSWSELLAEINRLANSKFKGNSWAAWSEGTPKQKSLIKEILRFPGHIIATMRVKTEWIFDGKKPIRAGLDPEAGKGMEYEFDMLMEINQDHTVYISKDRTGKFQDKTIDKPGKELGQELKKWLNDGNPSNQKEKEQIEEDFKGIKPDLPEKEVKETEFNFGEDGNVTVKKDDYSDLIDKCETIDELQTVWISITKNKGSLGEGVKYLDLEVAKNDKKKEFNNV